MKEVVFSQTRMKGPKTYSRGSVAIDGIWVTEELEVMVAAYIPFDPELGDHRPVVVNITKTSTLGVSGPKIKPSVSSRLNSKIKQIQQKYIVKLKKVFRKHRILERLATLEERADEKFSKHAKVALENLDSHITALVTNAEKQCRMLYKNHYDFSPNVKYWLKKGRALRALIRLKLGKEGNIANV